MGSACSLSSGGDLPALHGLNGNDRIISPSEATENGVESTNGIAPHQSNDQPTSPPKPSQKPSKRERRVRSIEISRFAKAQYLRPADSNNGATPTGAPLLLDTFTDAPTSAPTCALDLLQPAPVSAAALEFNVQDAPPAAQRSAILSLPEPRGGAGMGPDLPGPQGGAAAPPGRSSTPSLPVKGLYSMVVLSSSAAAPSVAPSTVRAASPAPQGRPDRDSPPLSHPSQNQMMIAL